MAGEADLTLVWPESLFRWEAERIFKLPMTGDWPGHVALLLREAFEDADVANNFVSLPGSSVDQSVHWFQTLLSKGAFHNAVPPTYYGERHGHIGEQSDDIGAVSLGADFASLVFRFAEEGYFPKVLPVECVDDYSSVASSKEVAAAISRAIKFKVDWPISDPDGLPAPVLYSLIEFFHDQAQRPRSSHWHSFSDCGWHYSDWSADSGRVVYRWRVNSMLDAHGVALALGSTGDERGRLIQRFAPPLNDLADTELAQRADDAEDEVAHAIVQFRERGASMTQKRSALRSLAGALEARNRELQAFLTKKDESDLSHIANAFAIRHNNANQKADWGDEYAEWIFWNYLAAINLVDAVKRRTSV